MGLLGHHGIIEDPRANHHIPTRLSTEFGHRRVLIIDDDADVREAIAEALENDGFEVDRAAGGEEALERLRSGPRPSVILLDLLMPGMDGTEFLSQLRSDPALADIPVAIATGLASTKLRQLVQAEAYFFKPYDGREISRELARICDRALGAPR